MRQLRWLTALLIIFTLSAGPLFAQLPITQLGSVFPPGAQAGTETTISIVDGTDLDELSGVVFSHRGITQLERPDPTTNPRSFKVKVAGDVPAGYHAIRVEGRFGVSNSRMFRVESQPVVTHEEKDWQNDQPLALTVDTVVYSRCEARADIDEFLLTVPAGEWRELRLDCLPLDSPMIPVIEVFHPNGRRIAYARRTGDLEPRLRFQAAAAGDYRIRVYDFLYAGSNSHSYRLLATNKLTPTAVQPPVMLTEGSTEYQGKTLPADQPAVPLQVTPVGSNTQTILAGFINPREILVPRQTAQLTGPGEMTAIRSLPTTNKPLISEQEPNNELAETQEISNNCEVIGYFNAIDDIDRYRIPVQKGDVLWLQLFAQRDGQLLDPLALLEHVTVDANGKETRKAVNVPDDIATNLVPNVFDTLTDDVDFNVTAPEAGWYDLTVRNRYAVQDDETHSHYRLRVSPPEPGFQVFAYSQPPVAGKLAVDTPAGCVARRGGTALIKLAVSTTHGYNQGILVEAPHPPPGVRIPPVLIPPGTTTANLIIYASADAPVGFAELQLLAKSVNPETLAEIGLVAGQSIVPVELVAPTQGNDPAVSRQGHQLVASVIEPPVGVHYQPQETPVVQVVTQSQQVWAPLSIQRGEGFADKVTLKAEGLDKNAKVTVETPEIAKEATQSNVRFQFKADTKEGWHTCDLLGEATIQFVRNPPALARAEAEFNRLTELVKATEAKVKTAEEAAKSAESELKTQQTTLDQQKESLNKTTAAIAELKKAIADLDQQLTAATEEAAKAELQESKDAKQTELTAAEAELKKLTAAVQDLDAKVKELTARVAATKKNVETAKAELAAAQPKVEAAKKNFDKVKNEQKPAGVKQIDYCGRLVFLVKKAPLKLTTKPGAEISLKKGESLEVEVELAREGDAKFPAELTFTLPPGLSGLSWAPVSIGPEDKTGKIRLMAGADAPSGKHTLCTVRAVCQQGDQTLAVDAPLTITIP